MSNRDEKGNEWALVIAMNDVIQHEVTPEMLVRLIGNEIRASTNPSETASEWLTSLTNEITGALAERQEKEQE